MVLTVLQVDADGEPGSDKPSRPLWYMTLSAADWVDWMLTGQEGAPHAGTKTAVADTPGQRRMMQQHCLWAAAHVAQAPQAVSGWRCAHEAGRTQQPHADVAHAPMHEKNSFVQPTEPHMMGVHCPED